MRSEQSSSVFEIPPPPQLKEGMGRQRREMPLNDLRPPVTEMPSDTIHLTKHRSSDFNSRCLPQG